METPAVPNGTNPKASADRPKIARLEQRIRTADLSIAGSGNAPVTPRMRGRKLQERRARWFNEHPLCVHCERRGLVRQATELDHIVPLFKGGSDSEANLQGLCFTCHAVKTVEDMKPGL